MKLSILFYPNKNKKNSKSGKIPMYMRITLNREKAEMVNMSKGEEEMFKFLQHSFHLSAKEIKPALEKLLVKLKTHENNRLVTRAFLYLDVISWLESKISNVPVQQVIRNKFLASKKHGK